MALFRPILGSLSGSIANVTFSRNRFGAYIRNRTKPVDPQTPSQQTQRALMQSFNITWKALTAIQRQAWADYAAGTPTTNALGDEIFLTGRQMYLRNNLFLGRFTSGVMDQDDAPIFPGFGDNALFTIDGDIINGLRLTTILDVPDGAQAQIQVSPPLAPTRNFYKGPWTATIRGSAPFAVPVVLIPPAEVFEGQKYFVAIRIWDVTNAKLAQSVTVQNQIILSGI